MTQPVLTVVMPIYNGEKYVQEAIDSILVQTFPDFELIIINDGSTDRSLEIITSYTDTRIRILNNKKNQGIPYNRNLGLKEAKGDFLCWADCDDLSLPERFDRQVRFLRNNSEFGGCGTWLERFKGSHTIGILKAIENSEEIRASLLFRPATIPNATAMLRLSEIKKHKLWYNSDLPISEDYDFIFRCSRVMKFSNIQEVLYKYRDSETSIMKKFENQEEKRYDIKKIIYRQVLSTLAIKTTEVDLKTHDNTCSINLFSRFHDFKDSYHWLKKIKLANKIEGTFDSKALNKILADQFFYTAKKASKFGFKTLLFFIFKSLTNNWGLHPIRITKLAIRCAIKYDKFEYKNG
ncbi:glycosyltransferase involved in cell wall biosynthesis [Arenibacter algicola]|uniref:Glycosyltransferase involved in cell wall biosynthesis n=1 Tax=Arenibacter algicola TaxID=616991 RepID=A0ABY3ACU3_9FLAO